MRGLAHLLSILFALPQVLICLGFLLLAHMTGGGTWGSMLLRPLNVFLALFSWQGLSGVLFLVILLATGFAERTRRAAAATVAAMVIASAVTLIVQLQLGVEQAFVFVPGLFSLVLSVALTVENRMPDPRPRTAAS